MKYVIPFLFLFLLQSIDCSNVLKAENKDCTISRLIVKQIINPNPVRQLSLVCEVTACHVAQQVGISINDVDIIAYNQPFFGKYQDDFPVTLHRQVPGVPVSTLTRFNNFSLYQQVRLGSWMYEKWGPLPVEQTGVTARIIRDMSLHDDLPPIVAFDVFVGNHDRSNPNLFYDSATDHFYGIDLGEAFKFNLAKETCRHFEWLIEQKYRFVDEELHALDLFLQTLNRLVQHFGEGDMLALFAQYLCKAGFVKSSPLYTAPVKKCIQLHREVIKEGVRDSKRLIKVVSDILSAH